MGYFLPILVFCVYSKRVLLFHKIRTVPSLDMEFKVKRKAENRHVKHASFLSKMIKLRPRGMSGLFWSHKHIFSGFARQCHSALHMLCPLLGPLPPLCSVISLPPSVHPSRLILGITSSKIPFLQPQDALSVQGLAQWIAYSKCLINACGTEQSWV